MVCPLFWNFYGHLLNGRIWWCFMFGVPIVSHCVYIDGNVLNLLWFIVIPHFRKAKKFVVSFGTCGITPVFTKLNSRRLKVKTQLYYIYIYIYIYIERTIVTPNNYMFRPLTGHHHVVHSMKRVEGSIMYNVTSVWWRDLVHRNIYLMTSLT